MWDSRYEMEKWIEVDRKTIFVIYDLEDFGAF